MADVTERMLALLSLLQTGRAIGGDELARRLEVSPRTVRRDVDRLRGYGYPVETQPGPGGFYRLAAGRTMPPLVLDDDEAVATLLALAALAAVGPAEGGIVDAAPNGIDDAATRAYGKLDQFLPTRLRPLLTAIRAGLETSPQQAPTVTAQHLSTIAEAITHRETITFRYVDAAGNTTERRVDPYRQIHHLLRWYLMGWDTRRKDWRVFRVDRVHEPVRTGHRYPVRDLPADSASEYLRRNLRRGKEPVDLLVDAPVEHVVDALKFQEARIRSANDDRTAVGLDVDSWQWLVLILAFVDADFRIDGSEALLRSCRLFAQRLSAATDDSGTAPASRPDKLGGWHH
ncbi:putative DNA-binding transcriptional regulator YafY [Rhodococcus sp. SMB37]|uniref:helix-turn-helix transcriptional regulator n=1 Tax=Rhodococcus sp. SMB37 TaxID=2512213 RepID=UPI001053120A|nr:WYL domain-containing protein [Rhodococcus sp. SMB37]TCN49458.1 putative DNA-binding transcriptional regulator YafY [Rhodococcus sp. SMB37]